MSNRFQVYCCCCCISLFFAAAFLAFCVVNVNAALLLLLLLLLLQFFSSFPLGSMLFIVHGENDDVNDINKRNKKGLNIRIKMYVDVVYIQIVILYYTTATVALLYSILLW